MLKADSWFGRVYIWYWTKIGGHRYISIKKSKANWKVNYLIDLAENAEINYKNATKHWNNLIVKKTN
jgi:Holliday junction resolvase